MVMLDQTQESYIAIRFVEPGSVIFIEQPQLVNVHPLQLLAVAEFLRVTANATLLEMREAGRVQVPRANVPDGVLKP